MCCEARPCTVSYWAKWLDGVKRPKGSVAKRSAEVEGKYAVMDWWLAGPPELIATWGNISTQWQSYVERNNALGIGNAWSHFIWPQHAYQVLGVVVRFSSAVCGVLARGYFGDLRQHQMLQRQAPPWHGCFDHGRRAAHLTNQSCPLVYTDSNQHGKQHQHQQANAQWLRSELRPKNTSHTLL